MADNQGAPVGSHGTREQTEMHTAVEWALRNAGLTTGWLVDARTGFLDELGERGFLVRAAGRGQRTDEPTEADRRIALATERLASAISAHIAKTHEPAFAAEPFSRDSVKLLLQARELLRALVGDRPAAPDRDEVWAAVNERFWAHELVSRAWSQGSGPEPDTIAEAFVSEVTDAVVDLLSRSAAPDREQELRKALDDAGDLLLSLPYAHLKPERDALLARIDALLSRSTAGPDEETTGG